MSTDAGLALTRMAEQVKQQVAKAQELHMVLLSTQVQGTAADDQVLVRVGVNGAPVAIELDPKVMRLAPEELAKAIVTASNAATAALERRSHEVLAQIEQVDMHQFVRDLQRQFEPPAPVPTPEADEFVTEYTTTLEAEAERGREELATDVRDEGRRAPGVTIETGPEGRTDPPTADEPDDSGWFADDGAAGR